jgi:hypothetical protein
VENRSILPLTPLPGADLDFGLPAFSVAPVRIESVVPLPTTPPVVSSTGSANLSSFLLSRQIQIQRQIFFFFEVVTKSHPAFTAFQQRSEKLITRRDLTTSLLGSFAVFPNNSSMETFENFFRKADLNQDGKISGSEAVAFFQGFGLPQQVLAQVTTSGCLFLFFLVLYSLI